MMRRRAFITLLGAAAAAWPLAAGAQSDRVRRVGVLMGITESTEAQSRLTAFKEHLQALGWVDGRNLRIDYRWGAANPTLIRSYVAELIAQSPDVILVNGANALTEVRQQTRTVSIVFVNVADPVDLGFVASLARPGANITGFTNIETSVTGKWLEILKDMAPHVANVSVILDRRSPSSSGMLGAIERVAPSFGFRLTPAFVESVADIARAIEAVGREPNSGLLVVQSIFIGSQVELIVGLAAQYRVPSIYPYRYFVSGGGLMSYSIDLTAQMRQAADYADRIMRGEKPADLPVQQPTKFELAINLKTAKALGLDVPAKLLALADEVIE